MKLIPSSASSGMPKVKRSTPEFTSAPTRPSIRPRSTMATALSREPRPRPSRAGPRVPDQPGQDRGGLARKVDQDRRRGAAVLGPVIDAGKHDQRGDRREAEGERQKHRDGRGRADAG